MSPDITAPLPARTLDPLRRQIGTLCQFVRFAAAGYALWVCWSVATLWISTAQINAHYGRWLKTDLSGIALWQQLAGFALHGAICLLVVAACVSAWRLFSGYLEGRIFTLDAAQNLRRVGLFGLGAEIADIIARPLISMILTVTNPPGSKMIGIAVDQKDLAFLMFLTAYVALAQIFTKAAEIAQENEEIV